MKRTLTVRFDRSVSESSGRPERMEVIVQSLVTASDQRGNTTYPPVRIVKMIELSGENNLAVFELLPSYTPGLDRPILYRISWRKEYLGRIDTTDFSMPNEDVYFDDLFDLGEIIGNETYLRETDLGAPGRVARLNEDGQVIDANGNPITGSEGVDQLTTKLNQEILDRKTADSQVRTQVLSQLDAQIASVTQSTTAAINGALTELRTADTTERIEREAAVSALNTTLSAILAQHAVSITDLINQVTVVNNTLPLKADLVSGKIPTSQIPSIALTTAVSVDNETQMLALTSTQVQPGDFAIRPDSTWILVSSNPALLASWKKISAGNVTSVNGRQGVVNLTAADVGARVAGAALEISEVTGLGAALTDRVTTAVMDQAFNNMASEVAGKASTASVTALRNDAVLKTSEGYVPSVLLDDDVPLVNALNQLVKKDGTVLSTGGEGGAVASVNGKVGTVVLSASDVGARPVGTSIPMSDITSLVSTLSGKAAQSDMTAVQGRITAAEADIAALQAGGGSGGGSARTTLSWVDDGTNDISKVRLRSPFGRDGSNTLYYNALGVPDADAVWPYVSASGNLSFRKVVPGADPDPAWATVSALDALATVVTSKASVADLTALSNLVATKASQASLDALTTVVNGKASQTDLAAVQQGLTQKANQSSLDQTNLSLQDKVDSVEFDDHVSSMTAAIAAKYQVPPEGIPKGTLEMPVQNQLTRGDQAKTDVEGASASGTPNALVRAGSDGRVTVPTATAAGNPVRKDQMDTALGNKADSSALTSGLAGKADLVAGKIPTSQIPAIATHETYVVANRAAMLALTTAQVQIGDTAIISGTTDQGTYTLGAADPSVFSNWLKHQAPPGTVQSVNGFSGTVVLGPADVGARSASTPIPQSDVTGLSTTLTGKADKTYVDQQIATRTTPSQVTDQVSLLGQAKLAVDYVAFPNPVASLAGQQSIDGVLTPLDSKVLTTSQSSSGQNGIWIVKSGAWVRASDAPSGGTLLPGTMVTVKSGNTFAHSIWQMKTATPVTIDTNGQTWERVLQGGPPINYTGGNGITVSGTTVSAKAGAGIIVDNTGIRLDTANVLRRYTVDIPEGATLYTANHNLGTQYVWPCLLDKFSGDIVLVGGTANNANQVTVELESAAVSGQWGLMVFG